MTETRSRKSGLRRRWAAIAATALFIAALVAADDFYYSHFKIVNVDDFRLSPAPKEAFFNDAPPTPEEIEKHLRDKTILLVSLYDGVHTPRGNHVFYFDGDHGVYEWFGGDQAVHPGAWSLRNEYHLLEYRGRRKLVKVQVFCLRFFDIDPIEQQDNCGYVQSLAGNLLGIQGTQEIASGDALRLSSMKRPPFNLPQKITLEGLRAMVPAE